MGTIKLLKCKHCGNSWKHYAEVGFAGKPIKGNKEDNTTGDADEKICCPKCGSEDYEQDKRDYVGLWD